MNGGGGVSVFSNDGGVCGLPKPIADHVGGIIFTGAVHRFLAQPPVDLAGVQARAAFFTELLDARHRFEMEQAVETLMSICGVAEKLAGFSEHLKNLPSDADKIPAYIQTLKIHAEQKENLQGLLNAYVRLRPEAAKALPILASGQHSVFKQVAAELDSLLKRIQRVPVKSLKVYALKLRLWEGEFRSTGYYLAELWGYNYVYA